MNPALAHSEILVAELKKMHPQEKGWIFVPEMRFGTGYGGIKEQRIDAWAIQAWETPEQQGSNKRNNHTVEIGGVTRTVSQWARIQGVSADLIFCRIRRGWSGPDAVLEPKRIFRG